MNHLFDDIVAVVQYARKDTEGWRTMAAFDQRSIAEQYAEECSGDTCPWKYKVVDVPERDTL